MPEMNDVFSLQGDFTQAIAQADNWSQRTAKATDDVKKKYVDLNEATRRLTEGYRLENVAINSLYQDTYKLGEVMKTSTQKTKEFWETFSKNAKEASMNRGNAALGSLMPGLDGLPPKIKAVTAENELFMMSQRRTNTLMVQGAAIIDDFSSQVLTAGFGPALRATTNNISFMASQFGGAMALWGTGAAVLGSLLIPKIYEWAASYDPAIKAAERAAEAQKKLGEEHEKVLKWLEKTKEFNDKERMGAKPFERQQAAKEASERIDAARNELAQAVQTKDKLYREHKKALEAEKIGLEASRGAEGGVAFVPGVKSGQNLQSDLLDAQLAIDQKRRQLHELEATENLRRTNIARQELTEIGGGIGKRFMEGFERGKKKDRPSKALFDADQQSDDLGRQLRELSREEDQRMQGVKIGSHAATKIHREFSQRRMPIEEQKKAADNIVSDEKSKAERAERQRQEQTETLKEILGALGGGTKRAAMNWLGVNRAAPAE